MSQSGIVKVSKQILPPSVATSYIGNVGVAVPSGNVLYVLGGTDINVVASGDTLAISYTGTPGGIVTIDGDSGSMTGNTVTISGGTTGLTTSASSATMNLTGILKLANGGTNANLTASNGGIFYSTATAGAILAGTATAGQIIRSGASTAPTWSTATYPATAGTSGNVLTSDGTNWNSTAPAASGISTIDGDSGSVTGSTVTISGGTTGLTTGCSGTTMSLTGTLAIANGGTDATSFGTTHGIVVYDGTRLANYAGPQLSTGGIMTNSSQPAVMVYLSGNVSNVTGDGTVYTVAFNTASYDNGSNFNTSTHTFTAPVTGKYLMTGFINSSSVFTASHTQFYMYIATTASGGNYQCYTVNPYNTAGNDDLIISFSLVIPMAATNTAQMVLGCGTSTKVVGVSGGAAGTQWNITLLPC